MNEDDIVGLNEFLSELEILAELENLLLNFIDQIDEAEVEECFKMLTCFIEKMNLKNNINRYSSVLSMISHVFFTRPYKKNINVKISSILEYLIYSCNLTDVFSSQRLLKIFENNKFIILFFYENHVIDKKQLKRFLKEKVTFNLWFYFYPEFPSEVTERYEKADLISLYINDKYSIDELKKLRREGKSDKYINQVIQNDDLDAFVSMIGTSGLGINTMITPSFMEDLLDNPMLIEYAIGYESVQIFKYLILNRAHYTYKCEKFAICGGNYEIYELLKEKEDLFNHNSCLLLALHYHREEFYEDIILNQKLSLTDHQQLKNLLLASNCKGLLRFFVQFFNQYISMKKEVNFPNQTINYSECINWMFNLVVKYSKINCIIEFFWKQPNIEKNRLNIIQIRIYSHSKL
ncbi:hypothetical protein TRFO_22536 [Tritrichomonas foetus]|uniref:DUF3447 domain-containing protein n=1 Tax=Tritrichomonas foetus TaxID=1144522 RepID=A0A1J4KCB1_9EUKA|nr:hypothetical protein TRFO_22536 [Tritrichomonas foetus]|eukprot:OHT08859.1 hypothetical protein TRFO_22536 [Tritrichomonas foetus]